MSKYNKYLGVVYGELTCTAHAGLDEDSPSNSKYVFTCVCGDTRVVVHAKVANQTIKRCHLCALEAKSKHKMWGTGLYNSWRALKARCKSHQHYKDRGYPAEWLDFEGFCTAMREGHFDGAVLDRIDNEQGYSVENCQWLSKSDHGKKTGRERNAKHL